MKRHIDQLGKIARKDERKIIGLMSGTSLDGLDIALCNVSGSGRDTNIQVSAFETIPYQNDYRERVLSVFSKRTVDLETVCLLNPWIGKLHGQHVNSFLSARGIATGEIDLIASHGQTIYHAPKRLHRREGYGNATLQIGDADHLSAETGIVTVGDFRQRHIAAGGEGAPLALHGDSLIFHETGEDRILLNIGGIANLTFLPGASGGGVPLGTDIGPGNTMMDAYIQGMAIDRRCDTDSQIARKGAVNDALLEQLQRHDFFDQPYPKTTGPELFNMEYLRDAQASSDTADISDEDVLRTLNGFAAECIATAIEDIGGGKAAVYCSGGGVHNPLLMDTLAKRLKPVPIRDTSALGIDPDAKEAVIFAALANELLCGGEAFPEQASLGKISFPD